MALPFRSRGAISSFWFPTSAGGSRHHFICPPQTIYEDRRVLNLIQEPCDNCKEASYDRGRRRWSADAIRLCLPHDLLPTSKISSCPRSLLSCRVPLLCPKIKLYSTSRTSIHTSILYSHRPNFEWWHSLTEYRTSTNLGSVDTTVAAMSHTG